MLPSSTSSKVTRPDCSRSCALASRASTKSSAASTARVGAAFAPRSVTLTSRVVAALPAPESSLSVMRQVAVSDCSADRCRTSASSSAKDQASVPERTAEATPSPDSVSAPASAALSAASTWGWPTPLTPTHCTLAPTRSFVSGSANCRLPSLRSRSGVPVTWPSVSSAVRTSTSTVGASLRPSTVKARRAVPAAPAGSVAATVKPKDSVSPAPRKSRSTPVAV